MQIALAQLSAQLQRGLAPLYLLHGDEALLIEEAADAVRTAARAAGHTERTVFVASGARFDWSAVLAAGGSLSLFADRQTVELRVPSGKPGKEGSLALQQLAAAAEPGSSTLALVLMPRLDKATRSGAWFGALAAVGVAVQIDAVERPALPQWIAQRLALQHQRVAQGEAGQRTLQFFADRVEGNLLAAHQEIQKLGLLYPAGALSLAQIREAVLNVARYDIDGLREALLAGDIARLSRTLDGLMHEGEAPPLVLWAMSEEIRALAILRSGLDRGRPLEQLLKEAKVWGPRQNPVKKALQRLSTATLEAALQHAGKIDRLAKGVGQGNIWEEFLRLGLSLSAQK